MRRTFLPLAAVLLGCGPTVRVQPEEQAPEPVLEYCTQWATGLPCAREDGEGVCFTAGVCASPCDVVDDCPESWDPCLIVSCDAVEGVETRICQYAQKTPGC